MERQVELEAGAALGVVVRADRAAQLVRDLVADGEAEAGTFACLLGSEERLEHALQMLLRDARAAVADGQNQRLRVDDSRLRLDQARALHRLRGVEQDVEQHLLQTAGPSEHGGTGRAAILHAHPSSIGAVAQQRDGFLHRRIQRHRAGRVAADAGEVAEPLRDGQHARDVRADGGKAFLEGLGGDAALRLQDLQHRVDRRQGVGHFVAHARDHETERGEALHLRIDSFLFLAHAAPVKAWRSIARSSIGMHSAAAMTDSAIAASHTGRYEPARSNAAPPAQAPMNAPSWWPRNAIENSVERYFTPKIWPTRELVSGTVASQVTPSSAAKRYAPAAETGVEMNSAITSARTA